MQNTNPDNQEYPENTISPSEYSEFADSAESGSRPKSETSAIGDFVEVVEQYIDQDSRKWAILRQGGIEFPVPHSLFTTSSKWERLEKLSGITVISSAARTNLLKKVVDGTFLPAFCGKKRGWDGPHFGLGAEVFSPARFASKLKVIRTFAETKKFSTSCTNAEFWSPLIPLIKDQELILFGLATPFLGPLLDLLGKTKWVIPNPVFAWCGTHGRGKTTAAIVLPGSMIGTGTPPVGFGESFNFTGPGVEDHLAEHKDIFLGVDETNKAKRGKEGPDIVVPETVFTISDGRPLKRHHSFEKNQDACRVVGVITSNDPITVLGSSRKAGAFAARCTEFHMPDDRPYGVPTYIPKGFSSSAEFIERLNELAFKNYGAPMRVFLQKLVDDRFEDEQALLKRICKYIAEFMKALGDISDAERRRAKPMAAVYAAGRLARHYGALPGSDDIGQLKTALVKVWAMAKPATPSISKPISPADRLRRYVKDHKDEFVTVKRPRERSEEAFLACAGFKLTGRGGRAELCLPKTKFHTFNFSNAEKNALKADGILIGSKQRTSNNRRVRLVAGEEVMDFVYVVNLAAL